MIPRCLLRVALPCAAALSFAATAAGAVDGLPSFAPILAKTEPAVVNVATRAKEASEDAGEPEDMQDFFRRFFGGGGSRVRRALGSGFVISADGDIVTNNHVVEGADVIRVRMANDEEFDAKVVGRDEKTDLALLHVQAGHPLPTLALGDSEAVRVGDWVLAIGNPFGLTQTATAGIVSAKGRFLGAGPYDDFIQTDASINPGNSGGPLVDQSGAVIGINAAIVAPAGGNVGIGFAIPSKLAEWVIGQLRRNGTVVRGWLGVAVQPVTQDLARTFGLEKPEGALVADVSANGPAAKAGIQRGDVIVRWGERDIQQSRELPTLVAGTPPGTRVPVTLIRNGKRETVEVTVEKMPPERRQSAEAGAEPDRDAARWGLVVAPLSAQDARRLGVRGGIVVTEVASGSPADDAGLRPGDVIVQVNRRAVASVADVRRALGGDARRALLLVRRGDASVYVELAR
jgi:serine protease Do